MKNIFYVIILGTLYFNVSANNVTITNLNRTGNTMTFDITWENSWRSGLTYHDAVWIFFKQAANGGPSWQHANVLIANVDAGYETVVPSDNVGFFVRRSEDGNGTASTSVSALLLGLNGAFQDFKVMALEMVYVPTGPFYAGDGYSQGRIAKGDDLLESVHITSNSALTCGTSSSDIQYESGTCNDISTSFPIGYNDFYCMKYVITQGQYVDFLNCLDRIQQENRIAAEVSVTTISNVYVLCDSTISLNGNVVRCDANVGYGKITFYCDRNNNGVPNEADDGMSRACNYLIQQDWQAYLDWSGLRPFSFLEVEKACRGPLIPVQNEKCWGSSLFHFEGDLVNAGTVTERWDNSTIDGGIITSGGPVIRVGCNAPTSAATRELSNATFYGIIDIGNNPGDFFVDNVYVDTFEAVEGDGSVNGAGDHNVDEWPYYLGSGGPNRLKRSSINDGISKIGSYFYGRNAFGGGRGVRSNF